MEALAKLAEAQGLGQGLRSVPEAIAGCLGALCGPGWPARKPSTGILQWWLESAEGYASRHGTTLTKLISDYLEDLSGADNPQSDAPILRRLSGILPAEISMDEHRRFLADKFRD